MGALELVAVLAAAILGGAVQTTLGFGGAFVLVPLLAVLRPELVPGAVLIGLLPSTALVTWTERRVLDRRSFATMAVWRIPGIAAGTAVVALASTRVLTLVIAAALLVAVAVVGGGLRVRRTPVTLGFVGVASGFTGTAAALGGPPMALAYSDEAGPARRATLSAVATVGVSLALVSLALTGGVGRQDLVPGALIGVGLLVGTVAVVPVMARFDDRLLRHGVLAWAGVGAVAAALRALA